MPLPWSRDAQIQLRENRARSVRRTQTPGQCFPCRLNRQIPWAIQQCGISEAEHLVAILVDNDERALLHRGGAWFPSGSSAHFQQSRTRAAGVRQEAVVRPSPLGPLKKSDCLPSGLISTMVEPVPCEFLLLLKLETRMSPACSCPPAAMSSGTNATPYGFTSPFFGIVETVSVGIADSLGMIAPCALLN